jgi:hypothetical protein
MGIEKVLTAPGAPGQNAFVERFIGSALRECFDHVIMFGEAACGGDDPFIVRTTNDPAHIYRWTRTADSSSRSRRPAMEPSSRSQRSAASIATNGARPERPRAAHRLPGTVLPDCMPAVRPSVSSRPSRHALSSQHRLTQGERPRQVGRHRDFAGPSSPDHRSEHGDSQTERLSGRHSTPENPQRL